MTKIAKLILSDKKKNKEIIRLCAEITSDVFKKNAKHFFAEPIDPKTIKKYHDQIVSLRKKIITQNLSTDKDIKTFSDSDIYNEIARSVSLKILRKEANKKH